MNDLERYAIKQLREKLKPVGESLSYIRYGKDEEQLEEVFSETLGKILECNHILKALLENED